jgi:hypothetical protein
LLEELEVTLAAAGVPVNLFRPGIGSAEVRNRFRSIDRDVPDEVVVWFQWHDGTAMSDSGRMIPILPVFEHWTLDMVIGNIRNPRLPYGHEPWEWNPEWIQLTGDNHGMAVNVAKSSDEAPLVRALVDDGPVTQGETGANQVVSLCTPVAWWIEAVNNAAIQWDRENNWWITPDFTKQPIERWQIGFL